jgi:tetratricopeptide (TPR) repeat protein
LLGGGLIRERAGICMNGQAAGKVPHTMSEDAMLRAQQFLAQDRGDLAVASLRALAEREPGNAAVWKLLGYALHDEQLDPEAVEALQRAAALDDHDVGTIGALAQSSYLAGLPAVQHFRRLCQRLPQDLNALRGHAAALAAEQQRDAAESMLVSALHARPDWLDGHRALTSLRFTSGDRRGFADSYAQACIAHPHNLALRLAWFGALAQIRDWPAAIRILDEAELAVGDSSAQQIARMVAACESGDDAGAVRSIAATDTLQDPVRDTAVIRFSLRKGDLATAERVALRNLQGAAAATMWPYLSLIWRLQGNPRAEWLDGSPPWVHSTQLDLSEVDLANLAALLRRLHTARSPYAEQSVRGGTQTDQNLFLRHEPILRELKDRVQKAVTAFVAQWPAPDSGHPLLGVPRDDAFRGRMHFSGSWSVRLAAQGFNVSHTHPMGWISSALYVALPQAEQLGPAPAGWIQFGAPPAELKLALQPTLQVEPKVGRLLLFPSRLWHSTVPFFDGERLVVAFDVRAQIHRGMSHERR